MKLLVRKLISKSASLAATGLGFALLMSAMTTQALAAPTVPEMDPGLATGAMALVSSGLLLIAGRRKSA
jgi:hypothetical protein